MPNLWVPPHRETVRRPVVHTPPVVVPRAPVAEVPSAPRLTRWSVEYDAGRAAMVDEGRRMVLAKGLGRGEQPESFSTRSFHVASHVDGQRGPMLDGLMYGASKGLFMTSSTVAGVTWAGMEVFKRAAAKESSILAPLWSVPVSTAMSPLGFMIFREMISAEGAISANDVVIPLWMEAVRICNERLWLLDVIAAGAEPGGATHHRWSIARVQRHVKDRAEVALYVQTMRLVLAETSRNLSTILMDGWPADWHGTTQGVLENPV